jgi:hypothetical protein
MAIGASTVVLFFSYLLIIFGFASVADEDPAFAGGLIGIGTGLVPAAFGCLAAVSQRPHAIRTALAATGLWVVIGGPVAIIDIPAGLVAGFGAGAVLAFNRRPMHTTASRAIAVAVVVAYVLVVGRMFPAAALMVGSVLPFAAVGVADSIIERETEAADDDLGAPA